MKIPQKPPLIADLVMTGSTDRVSFERILGIGPVVKGRYEHWDRLRYLSCPPGLTTPDWWLGVKLARHGMLKPTPLRDTAGAPFRFATPDPILRQLHEIDQNAAGRIEIAEEVTNPATRDRYVVNSLIEESVTSSQIEGAATTAEVARRMIRSGRKPANRSEQMIFNNYAAMQFVRGHRNEPLTPDLVLALHRVVAEEALDDPEKAGRFRTDADDTVVERQDIVVHVPPPTRELPGRLELMCGFANERLSDAFVHPVVRAVILHFWLAYDHPFVDGNGRTARALFYWSMLSQGYWLAEYLSISTVLRRAPAQYARAFLLTETDDNDLTYFLEYQLSVIQRSIEAVQQYLSRKVAEVRQVETLLRDSAELNHRQLALLSHALKHPGHKYSIQSHRRSHGVVYQTARTDLLDLAARGLLEQIKRGRSYQFTAAADLTRRLERKRGAR